MGIPDLRCTQHTPTHFPATAIFKEFLRSEMDGVAVKAKPFICADIIGCTQ